LIDMVTGGTVDSDSTDFGGLRTKLLENNRTFKHKSLKNFKVCYDD